MIKNLIPPTQAFDEIEVHPCMTIEKGKNGSKDIIEQCEYEEAEFWSVYVHFVDGGLECIADCDKQEEAIELSNFLEQFVKHYLI